MVLLKNSAEASAKERLASEVGKICVNVSWVYLCQTGKFVYCTESLIFEYLW